MGPKYEFTDETMNHEGHLLHRIRRLSDGKIGGWIEKEENLSQEGNCWVDDQAKVYGDAKVYDSACVYGDAKVYDDAKIYGGTKIYDDALVYGHAQVFEYAKIYDYAKVYDNAKVYGDAEVFNHAWVFGNAKIYGNDQVFEYDVSGDETTNEVELVAKDFIYKIDESNKLEIQTEYDSVDDFFNKPITNDIKFDTLVICSVDTKIPIIKLEKSNSNNELKYKFIVDITNENGDNFSIKSTIKTQDQLNQLISQTIEALKQYNQFSKYINDLENCL